MPDANISHHDVGFFFLGPLLEVPSAIRPALSHLLPSSAAVAIRSARRERGQLTHPPVTRAAHPSSVLNATDLPPLPSGSLYLCWGRSEKQLFPALPTLKNECPDCSMGSCDEDVCGG